MSNHQYPTVIYPGTFDPITNGHMDIVIRSSQMFKKVIIGIGDNPDKKPTFSATERKGMIEEVCKDLQNVEVDIFSGLAVDFARKKGARVLVRGLRTEADYVYEMQMAMMNRSLYQELETIFIPTRQDLSHVSSSLLKSVSKLGGDISMYVPKEISQRLTERYQKS